MLWNEVWGKDGGQKNLDIIYLLRDSLTVLRQHRVLCGERWGYTKYLAKLT
jgi:hypothetical protein